MADETSKKYYWIKLKTDFFNSAEIDFLLSQKNGCEYIVLYEMLCLNTANTGGEFTKKIGELIVPYDIERIVRDTKYFDFDTIAVALDLYKKLGLIYVSDDNRILRIANYDEMVGKETKWAKYKRNKKLETDWKSSNLISNDNSNSNSNKSIENKIIENKSIENNILHTYECHLLKEEKDSFCLSCQKKNVCNKKTSEGFEKVYGMSFEEFLKNKNEKKEYKEIFDYDWLNEKN